MGERTLSWTVLPTDSDSESTDEDEGNLKEKIGKIEFLSAAISGATSCSLSLYMQSSSYLLLLQSGTLYQWLPEKLLSIIQQMEEHPSQQQLTEWW